EAFTEEIGEWWRPNPLFALTPRGDGHLRFEPGQGGRLVATLANGRSSRSAASPSGSLAKGSRLRPVFPSWSCEVITIRTSMICSYCSDFIDKSPQRAHAPPCLRCHRTRRLEQEPSPPLGLVDPDLGDAGRRYIRSLVTEGVRLAQVSRELFVVVAQLGEHVPGRDVLGIIVEHSLQTPDVTNRSSALPTSLHWLCVHSTG